MLPLVNPVLQFPVKAVNRTAAAVVNHTAASAAAYDIQYYDIHIHIIVILLLILLLILILLFILQY